MKEKFYKTSVRPVRIYESECWSIIKKQEIKMYVTEMKMLKWMCNVTMLDIRNKYMRGN